MSGSGLDLMSRLGAQKIGGRWNPSSITLKRRAAAATVLRTRSAGAIISAAWVSA
jgi:hypothetical protein